MAKCQCCNADLGEAVPPCHHLNAVYEFFEKHPHLRMEKDVIKVWCDECGRGWGLLLRKPSESSDGR